MARLIREICQHEKPPGNEITEPPAFTVSKQELRGKAIVLVTFCARTRLGGSHQWENKNKAIFEEKKGNRGASADAPGFSCHCPREFSSFHLQIRPFSCFRVPFLL